MTQIRKDTADISILYVEDEPKTREMVSRALALKISTLRLHTAENGEAGLALYREYRPDIVITDINMPIMDGILMSNEIKSLNPEAIIIAVTAHSDTRYLLDAIETGINNYVLKPINYDKLFAAINKGIETVTLKRRVQEQNDFMEKNQRLESLGVLAGGIAHDFNNILTAIIGNISLARSQVGEGHKAAGRLAATENALARATNLTRQLLTFARGGEPIKKVIEVGGLLKEATGFAIHGSNVKCRVVLADDLWFVEADEGQLSQVIHNLVINAVQAMPEGGMVALRAENAGSKEEEGKFVKISVTDDGAGIPEHHVQRIFEPYFTTKQLGNGLGLATCYSIIKKHGGNITVESTPGKGSTFHVCLPASEQVNAAEPGSKTEVVHGSGRVLVMDDEEPVRETAQAMLEELGYTVECAENGGAAIELYRQRKEEGTPFNAVIMDLTIPGGMGGREAIASLLKLDPGVKAVVSSGYSNDPVMADYSNYGFSAVLGKPYRLQEISKVLQELLDI